MTNLPISNGIAPNIAIGILAFSRPDDLAATLASVEKIQTPNLITFLLQNGMPDSVFGEISSTFPWVVSIRNTRNLGAAGGRNTLVKLAIEKNLDFLFFLDSDAEINPDALNILIHYYLKFPNIGLMSCLVYEKGKPEQIHSSGISTDWHDNKVVFHTELPKGDTIERPSVITTAALISVDTLKSVPLLDERIFAYWEDVDWCLEMQKFGYHHYVVKDAIAFHASRERFHPAIIYYYSRNLFLLYRKHHPNFNFMLGLRLISRQISQMLRRIVALTPLSMIGLFALCLSYIHANVNHWGEAPKWMVKPREAFLEYKIYKFIFRY